MKAFLSIILIRFPADFKFSFFNETKFENAFSRTSSIELSWSDKYDNLSKHLKVLNRRF
jgi:hypothetical protein